MKKIFMITFIFLFVFTSCKKNTNKSNIYKELKEACDSVSNMELKGLEVYQNSTDLFEQYKEEKIKLILKVFDGSDYSYETNKLKEITTAFNRLTLDEDSFYYVEQGIETNPYLDLFNSTLLREIIMLSNENEFIELDKLKYIYLY